RRERGEGWGGEVLVGGEGSGGGPRRRRVQQHRQRGRTGDEQVGLAVAVDVAHRHGKDPRCRCGGDALRGGEGRGGGPRRRRVQQHRYVIGEEVGNDQVGLAVAVDVAQRHGEGPASGGEVLMGGEGGGGGPRRRRVQQHRHRVAGVGRGDQI